MPQIKLDRVDGITFLEQIMKPHTAYYKGLKGLLGDSALHGMAHITGGGLAGNLSRVIPAGLSAQIDLSKIRPLPIFRAIKEYGAENGKGPISTDQFKPSRITRLQIAARPPPPVVQPSARHPFQPLVIGSMGLYIDLSKNVIPSTRSSFIKSRTRE